jgi:hypothetical protein
MDGMLTRQNICDVVGDKSNNLSNLFLRINDVSMEMTVEGQMSKKEFAWKVRISYCVYNMVKETRLTSSCDIIVN